jgi:hypothetical protein
LYITVAGLIGVSLGALFRNTAAGIATFAGVFFVIPPLASLLPSSISGHVDPLPALERGGGPVGRGAERAERARAVDRVRAPVRVRRGPHRRGGLAAAALGRLSKGDNP